MAEKKNQDFEVREGSVKTLTVSVVDESAAAQNITDATINWKAVRHDGQNILTKATGGSGITITSGVGGTFTISLVAADTTGFAGRYAHEARITDTSSNISTVMTGTMTVLPTLI